MPMAGPPVHLLCKLQRFENRAIMDTATQPILCCVGESVRGQPTQFLMERAFEECGLDWQALSVEVQAEQLETALAGMQAMGIRAARFFGALQDIVAQSLSGSDSRWLAPVSSIQATGQGWQAWHTDGLCLPSLLPEEVDFANCQLCLFGDSRITRSVRAGWQSHAGAPRCAWVGGPSPEDMPKDISSDLLSLYTDTQPLLEALQKLEATPDSPTSQLPPVCLVDCEPETADNFRHLLGDRRVIWVGNGKLPTTFARVDCISNDDLMIAGEVYDFHRWTGRVVETSFIRDAHDEYDAF